MARTLHSGCRGRPFKSDHPDFDSFFPSCYNYEMDDPIEIIKKADEYREKDGDFNKAIDILEDLLVEVKKDPIILCFYVPLILKKLGNLYRDIGDTKKAKETYEEALKVARNDLNKTEESDILTAMAFLELKTGDADKALKYAKKAEENIGPKRGIKFAEVRANTFAVLGNIYFEKGDFEEATEKYRFALFVAKNAKNIKREVTIVQDIANLNIVKGDYYEAKRLLQYILKKSKGEEYCLAVPQMYLRLGKAYQGLRKLDQAKENFEKALQFAQEKQLVRDIAESYEALGDYFSMLGDESSKSYYENALDIFEKGNYINSVVSVKKKLQA